MTLLSTDMVAEIVIVADNKYNEGWTRPKIVAYLQSSYQLRESEAKTILIAVERVRYKSRGL